MTEQDLKNMRELDRIADKAGGYVSPMFNPGVHYDYRKISEYCRARNMEPQDLTIRELRKFVV